MLPEWCVGISICVRLGAVSRYAWGVLHRPQLDPNPVTWLLWGLTGLTALAGQLPSGVTGESFVLLAQGATPLAVFGLTVRRYGIRRHLTPLTLTCAALSVAGVAAWRITTYPPAATAAAILADFLAAFPTYRKAFRAPSSEYPLPFLLNSASMTVTVLTLHSFVFTAAGFPLYLVAGNLLMFTLATVPFRRWLTHGDRPTSRRVTSLVSRWGSVAVLAVAAGLVAASLTYRFSDRGTAAAAAATRPITLASYGLVTVIVHAPHGPTRTWRLLAADTTPLIEHGLMGVSDRSLGGHRGMLFEFAAPTTVPFWMKNTPRTSTRWRCRSINWRPSAWFLDRGSRCSRRRSRHRKNPSHRPPNETQEGANA